MLLYTTCTRCNIFLYWKLFFVCITHSWYNLWHPSCIFSPLHRYWECLWTQDRGQNFTQAQCSGKRMRVLNSSCTQRLLPFICRLKMIPCEQQTICTFLLIIHSTIWHKSLPKQYRSLFFQQRIKVCINSRLPLLQKTIKPTKRGRLSHKLAINVNQNSIYNVWKIFQCFHVL